MLFYVMFSKQVYETYSKPDVSLYSLYYAEAYNELAVPISAS